MSNVIVRPCTTEDRESLLRVWSLTYNDGTPFDPEPTVFSHGAQFVAEQDGVTVGGFAVMPMTATRGQGLMQSAGVLAVAVSPAARGGGVGGTMMRWALRHYREQGFELASLYAFRETYYRRFGYESCGKRLKITVDTPRLPEFKQELPVRTLSAEDVDLIKDCYTGFAQRRTGMNLRNKIQWERAFGGPKAHRTLYAVGDPVEAYAIIQHKGAFWEPQSVEEVIWSSRRGYDSIMAVLRTVAINKTKLSWNEPIDGPFLTNYLDHGCQVEIERLPMFRILDVPLALQQLKPEGSGEFTLAVLDSEIPENFGPWLVRFDPQGVYVERTHEADLAMDRRHFVQALLGDPSLRDLLNEGEVEVKDNAAAIAAQRLLPANCTYLADFF